MTFYESINVYTLYSTVLGGVILTHRHCFMKKLRRCFNPSKLFFNMPKSAIAAGRNLLTIFDKSININIIYIQIAVVSLL